MFVWAALLFFQQIMLDLPKVDKNPHTTADDLALGRKLYAGRCAGCHGPAGDGGKGANLATPTLMHAESDLGLYRVIRYGLPETEMPSHNLAPREIWQIAAFVKTLGRSEVAGPAGDSRRGAAVLRSKGACLQCHIVNGEGGHTGPALTDIGQRRSPSYLRAKLLDPKMDLATSGFSLVQLTTRSGKKISGIRLNEDSFSVQLRDMDSRIHSFWKDDLKELKIEERTLMPSYKQRLTDQEINDLTAYLAGLRGQR